ncbi:MAG: hypothetical protein B6D62_01855 [Candidatus Cloacimonas sp. 4484_275]|nr:MAG: hypothetical protein B6D62_01855 [Candidatus Cloacimonas sp. 4484_275]RLC49404.1 MAG: DUF448 domain-containing protein [Candidatus Cloacimonadota bacterium]
MDKSSKAGHVPLRSCVICGNKQEKKNLLRFVLIENEIVFDLHHKIPGRGFYVCDENSCLGKMEKWLKKRKKKWLKKVQRA